MRIQHNIMAMNAYRNYTNNVSAMKANLEKLSSGYKINRAGDDAAGLAISEKMRAQITGLETAQKNAKDGISLVQTAEGALTEVHDMLNRMVELATQSANGTYDNETDRAQLQKEMDQLKTEINRIADSSNFNGIKLLDGSMEVGAVGGVKYDAIDAETIEGLFPEVGDPKQPTVDSELTILESDANGGDKASFEIRLDGLSSTDKDTNGTFTLKLGDTEFKGVQVTGKMSSKALAEAVAKENKTITINGSEYKVEAKDGKLTLTGDADSDVVTIANSKVTFDFKAGEYTGPASYTTGKYTAGTGNNNDVKMQLEIKDSTGANVLADTTAISIGETDTAAVVAEKLNTALADANIEGVSVKANDDGTFTIDITNEEYLADGATAVMTYTQGSGDGTFDDTTIDNNKTIASKSWETDTLTAGALGSSGATSNDDTGIALTIGDKTVSVTGLAYDTSTSDLAAKLQEAIDEDADLKGKVTVTESSGDFTISITDADLAAKTVDQPALEYTAGTVTGTGNTAGSFNTSSASATIASTDVKYNEGTANLGAYTKGTVAANATINITLKDADGNTVSTAITATVAGNAELDDVVTTLNNMNKGITFSNENGTLKATVNDKDTWGDAVTMDIAYEADASETKEGAGFAAQEGIAIDKGPGLTGSINGGVQNVQTPASAVGNALANTTIDLSEYFTDGTQITLGDTTYTVAVGADSKFKDAKNVVDLTDMEDDTLDTAEAARRLSEAAKGNNGIFSVGQNDSGKTTLQQLQSAKNSTDMTTVSKFASYIKISKADPASVETATPGKGLTLQIGDTADSYNQLKVSISDMHTTAMGISDISIADQESAAAAVDAIKAAINYVSDVRGTLGATQNRLDHTINNLSVMTENIQDAESTIRDTDVAEEMMAYTKNNILIQSAQAMLAQANQVPQGVLQLLQ